MEQPTKIAVYDLETDPFKHGRIPKVFSAGWFDGTVFSSKWGTEPEVMRWIINKISKFNGIVYAHNGGKFDFLGYVVKYAAKKLYGDRARVIAGRIVECPLGEAKVRDSYAILPARLASYDKGDIDYNKFESCNRQQHKREILDYLARDCRSLHVLVERFLATHGTRPLTAASAGFAFLKSQGHTIDPFSESLDKKFRKFYFGGLVQAKKPGRHVGRFSIYDIKSAYPEAMTHEHATGKHFEFIESPKRVMPTDFVVFSGKSGGLFLHRGKEKLTSPMDGIFHVTGWEYLSAKRLKKLKGTVLYVERAKQLQSYSRYVTHWYAEKEECENKGDAAGRHIAKIMLNAAYGKFAQRPDRYKEYAFMPHDESTVGTSWIQGIIDEENKYSIWEKDSGVGRYYNVATAASITGRVRSRVFTAIQETGAYYADTDSVICDSNRSPKGIGNVLGSWSLETEGDLLYVAGKKLYAMRILAKHAKDGETAKKKGYYWDDKQGRAWKIASKGVRLIPDEMRRICEGETVEWKNEAPSFSVKSSPGFVTRRVRMTV